MSRGSTWTNPDGIIVGFGTHTADNLNGASVNVGSVEQEIVFVIDDATSLSVTPANGAAHPSPGELHTGPVIPANSLITSAVAYVNTAFTSGGVATLDLGTYAEATDLAVDADVVNEGTVANLSADKAVTMTVTTALVAVDSRLAVTYSTAVFTAGSAKIVVKYIKQ